MKRTYILFKILVLVLISSVISTSYAVEKNNKPCLSNIEFLPYKGKIHNRYIARATYSDPDGDIPSNIAIYVDNTFYPLNLNRIIKKSNQGLESYEATYQAIISLPYGAHSYYFYAEDGKGKSDRIPRYGAIKSPFVGVKRPYNRAPTLKDGGVQFQEGTDRNSFIYSVWYYDPEYYEKPNKPPKEIAVYVDGIKVPMKLYKGNRNNGLYLAVYSFPEEKLRAYQYDNQERDPSRHAFYFRAIDADGFGVFLPEDGIIRGPELTFAYNNPPKLFDPKVEPAIGGHNKTYTYYVTYEDMDDELPAVINCVVNDNVHKMRFLTGSKHKGIYYYKTKQFAGNSHRYYFHAKDGRGAEVRIPDNGSYHGPVVVK